MGMMERQINYDVRFNLIDRKNLNFCFNSVNSLNKEESQNCFTFLLLLLLLLLLLFERDGVRWWYYFKGLNSIRLQLQFLHINNNVLNII